jgi:hypothetical protein
MLYSLVVAWLRLLTIEVLHGWPRTYSSRTALSNCRLKTNSVPVQPSKLLLALVSVSSQHLGPKNRFLLLPGSCGFVDLGRPLWREDGSVVYSCCQRSDSRVRVPRCYICYLRFEIPSNLEGQVPLCMLLATCFHPGFFLSLFFDPEDGGDIFLQSVDWLSADYTALYPGR